MKRFPVSVRRSLALVILAVAAPATAATQKYRATFVEMNGDVAGVSCGSATISGLGHVAEQCIAFDACGVNCHERTITFDDGSTLLILESVVDVITYGNSAGFLEITQTISRGSGRFEGATGGGTGVVNLNALAVIIASGDITLPDE